MRKDDLAYIDHIISCIKKIKKYMKGLTKSQFKESELIQDAVIRNIEIIGEATKNISMEFRKDYSNVPWKEIAGMRDKLIHHYMGVDIDVIWTTVKQDIPSLEKELKEIK